MKPTHPLTYKICKNFAKERWLYNYEIEEMDAIVREYLKEHATAGENLKSLPTCEHGLIACSICIKEK